MQSHEADELAIHLRKHFRTMSDEQMRACANGFEQFERSAVFESIQRHFERFEMLNAKALFDDVRSLTTERPEARAAAATEEADRRREAIVNEKRNTEKDVERMFATVRGMPDVDRERHRAAIVADAERLNPFLAKRLRDADPTKSPTLAAMICKRLRG